jgi:NTP pyrophosphatase (non-canonical NTP hydrolase)
MDSKTYLQESARSVSPMFNTDMEENFSRCIAVAFEGVILSGSAIDHLKRKVFYGKPLPENVVIPAIIERLKDPANIKHEILFAQGKADGNYSADLVHGILGVTGEASELLQALVTSMLDRKPIDRVNVIEEAGDLLWYIALILRSVDSTFDEAMDINIAKLRKRFPGQFTQEHALNRDLEGERKILEG